MGKYYTEIMGNDQASFLAIFNDMWNNEISSHNMPYSNAAQITEGNRLRPILMAWGYYANTSDIVHQYVADFAISIELIHKASILLDDLIDNDNARHGAKTFHVEYSKSEAILYAIYLINRSITLMHQRDIEYNFVHTPLLLKVVDNMSRGGIKEVNSNNYLSIQDVIDIINLETTTLIESSFFLGYRLSSKDFTKVPQDIYNIGHLCGYCFQVLNDIEPFLAPDINKEYKGLTNYDFDKNRKNLVISYLYGACTKSERNTLRNGANFDDVYLHICKYKIIDLVLEDIKSKISSIRDSLFSLKKCNQAYYIDFSMFLDNMFSICYEKCGLFYEKNFFYKG